MTIANPSIIEIMGYQNQGWHAPREYSSIGDSRTIIIPPKTATRTPRRIPASACSERSSRSQCLRTMVVPKC